MHVRFYDTTLRDGEQMPRVAFSRAQRCEIALALDALGLDEIELGFAASGPAHRADIRAAVESGLQARTLSLARPLHTDIDAAVEAGVDGVILFAALSDTHLRFKLQKTREQVLALVLDAIDHALGCGLFVQLSLEDATRTDDDVLVEFGTQIAAAGVHRIGLADTVGIATPSLMQRKVAAVVREVEVPVSVHCQDDLGLAVANSLAAVEAGASVLSTTMNGIGERSGNASTEVCAAALVLLHGHTVSLDLEAIASTSEVVARCAGVEPAPNSPLVGANSFRHESGIHIAAVLRNPACYEPFDPERIGRQRELELGKTSGRAAVRHLGEYNGTELDDVMCSRILARIKTLTENGTVITDDVLLQLVDECTPRPALPDES